VATRYSLSTEQTGLQLSLEGFTDVVPKLLDLVLQGLAGGQGWSARHAVAGAQSGTRDI
jgi:secreted Zn-dependent insulinase-like peptidase